LETSFFRRRLLDASSSAALCAIMFTSTPAAADLLMTFQNDRDDAKTLPYYITFGSDLAHGALFSATGTVNGVAGVALAANQSYLYSEDPKKCAGANTLCGLVDVSRTTPNAKVFVSLGKALTVASDGSANYLNPTGPNFTTRYDKFEFTYNGSTGGANLTSADFVGLPLQLKTAQTSHAAQTLTWNYSPTDPKLDTQKVFTALGALSNFSTNTAANALGAIVTNGLNGVTVTKPDKSQLTGVVRIISPSSTNGGQTPYPDFTAYLHHLQTGGAGSKPIVTEIAGNNGRWGSGNPPALQTYDLTSYISNDPASTETVNGVKVAPGDLLLKGTVSSGGVSQDLKILITAAQLTTFAIYGAAITPAQVEGPDDHRVVDHAVADYLAGLSLGFIGSAEANPNLPGKTIGESPSWTWYGTAMDGNNFAPLETKYAYAAAQPSDPYYNPYAAYLNNDSGGLPVTDSYGFPYTDRLTQPLANLYPDTTLTMEILKDSFTGLGGAVPEPSTWALMLAGFAGMGYSGYRRNKRAVAA
jgi:hypothetical protein